MEKKITHQELLKTKLFLVVSPNSKNPRIEKNLGIFKFFLSSPPAEGKANQELIKTIAKILRTPSSQIKIIQGLSSKKKVIEILSGLNQETIEKILEGNLCK